MASKKAAPTDDDLLAQLDSLSTQPKSSRTSARPATQRAPRSTHGTSAAATSQTEQDLLAELGSLAQRPSSSRPGTPSIRTTAAAAAGKNIPSGHVSEDTKPSSDRKSADSTRSSNNAHPAIFTPATTTSDDSPADLDTPSAPAPGVTAPKEVSSNNSGGGGWGSWLSSTVSSAVTQAQARVQSIQQNTNLQQSLPLPATLTSHLPANLQSLNMTSLRGLSNETITNLRSLALPTFQNIISTIAPPISAHERLIIHVTHDLQGYPSLDPTIYQVFSRIMSQVEGGDLLVVQRGNEKRPAKSSRVNSSTNIAAAAGGFAGLQRVGSWQDGPWWRDSGKRSTNAVRGLREGTRLCRASAESYSQEFFANKGGVEEAARNATEQLTDQNPTRDSQIFVAIQAITRNTEGDLFTKTSDGSDTVVGEGSASMKEEHLFALYLHDPIHSITFHTLSQSLPKQWIDWLDAPTGVEGALPESIEEIIESGGVDPREWVSEWLEESLSIAVGILAQRYVARRMGLDVDSKGKGKEKMRAETSTSEVVSGGGGEMARAMGGL